MTPASCDPNGGSHDDDGDGMADLTEVLLGEGGRGQIGELDARRQRLQLMRLMEGLGAAGAGEKGKENWSEGKTFDCFFDRCNCTLGKKLGEGGFGQVFTVDVVPKANSTADGGDLLKLLGDQEPLIAKMLSGNGSRQFALKRNKPEDVDVDAKTLVEAQMHARLPSHPNVLDLVHIEFNKDGELLIFSELIVGKELALLIQETEVYRADGKLHKDQAEAWSKLVCPRHTELGGHKNCLQTFMLELSAQLAGAVAHIHAHGLTHYDIKPGNIMVNSDGAIKLIDFGNSKQNADATG